MALLKYAAIAVACCIVWTIARIFIEAESTTRKYKHLPWAGAEKPTWYNLIRARIYNVLYFKNGHQRLVDQYWSQCKSCFVPSALGDEVVVPPDELDWILEQPASNLSIREQQREYFQTDFTLDPGDWMQNTFHLRLISKTLTTQLDALSSAIYEEATAGIDKYFNVSQDDYQEFDVFHLTTKIVARITYRVLVGPGLCRNPDLIEHTIAFAEGTFSCALILRTIPPFLRGILSPLVMFRYRQHTSAILRAIKPEIEARLKNYEDKQHVPPNDFLQWLLDLVISSNIPEELRPEVLIRRITATSFGALHTSAIAFTNALFDLISGLEAAGRLQTLQTEVDAVLAKYGTLSKSAVSELHFMDSAFKESARLRPLGAIMIERKVVKQGGIVSPLSNTYVHEGMTIGVPTYMMQTNPEVYAGGDVYDPTRFCKKNDEPDTTSLRTSSASSNFLNFGKGRHICPGRFFAAHELKVMLAYLISKYDVQTLETRPPSQVIGWINLVPRISRIRIKRRARV